MLFCEEAGAAGEDVGAALVSILLFSEPGVVVEAEAEPPVLVPLVESTGVGLPSVVPAAPGVAEVVDDAEDAAKLDASDAGALLEFEKSFAFHRFTTASRPEPRFRS